MNLTIDIGNTLTKAAIIDDGQVVDMFKFKNITIKDIDGLFKNNPGINAAIISSVSDKFKEIEDGLRKRVKHFVKFGPKTKIPIKNSYKTPETLGCDRLAGAVGATVIYPNTNVLVVDFGTAITIDLVTAEGDFFGGNISPGVMLRLRALHDHTSKLPLVSLEGEIEELGSSSESAIRSGAVNGIVYEIEGYIARLSDKYRDLKIIFTGGDGDFFAKRFKNPIFATYDLVSYGLNRILEYEL